MANFSTYSWWRLPEVAYDTIYTENETVRIKGVLCYTFDYYFADDLNIHLVADGEGVVIDKKGVMSYGDQNSEEFKLLSEKLHRENWLCWVEDKMERLFEEEMWELEENDPEQYALLEEKMSGRDVAEFGEHADTFFPTLVGNKLPNEKQIRAMTDIWFWAETLPTTPIGE